MKNNIVKSLIPLIFVFGLCGCGNNSMTSSVAESSTEPVATGIVISAKPNKTSYYVGESFDPTGMEVSLKYDDGSMTSVSDYQYAVADPLTAYSSIVKVSAEGYSVNLAISVGYQGNEDQYSVKNTSVLDSSSLTGKTYYFLGSSVTYGAQSKGESFADFLAKRNSCTSIKEAISGTTLGDKTNSYGDSYVTRFNQYLEKKSRVSSLDGFICQLSTNDASNDIEVGSISESTDISSFDVTTSTGAMEYLIAKVKEVYDCPVYFYTSPYFETEKTTNYRLMVDALKQVQEKWDITVLNLFDDAEFNNITEEQRKLYMADEIHPTKAGYREWWTPVFEEMLGQSV